MILLPCQTIFVRRDASWREYSDRPYVIASFAISLDGKLASGCGDTRLSSYDDKVEVHKLRSIVDGILVGINTILIDNPHLTVSEKYFKSDKHPIRIVLDSKCRIPADAEVITRRPDVPTIIATTEKAPKEKIEELSRISNVKVLVLGKEKVDIGELLRILRERHGIRILMVEGGGKVLGAFFSNHLVDYIRVSITPVLFGSGGVDMLRDAIFCRIEDSPKLELIRIELCGHNIVLHFEVMKHENFTG